MSLSIIDSELLFLKGGGQMGHLTRTYDWARTSLGPPDSWPQSLRTTLNILLNSACPMLLFWGDDLICFYNDAYRPSLGNEGKHPAVLGQPGAEAWPQIKPVIDQLLAGSQATWSDKQLIPVYRNGTVEDVYWTFSYSPVCDELGQPTGVLAICTETTPKVNTLDRLHTSEQLLQNLVREAPIGIIVLAGEDMRVELVNDAYARLINRRTDELLGKPLFTIIPEAKAVFYSVINQVRLTGEPHYFYGEPYQVYDAEGVEIKGFLNLVYQPYKDSNGIITGVIVHCQDVTAQKNAEEALRQSEAKLRSVIDTAPVAIGLFMGRDLLIELPNQTFIDIVGKGPDITGKPLREVMPELVTENQGFLQVLDDVFTSGKQFQSYGAMVQIRQQGVMTNNYYNITYTPLFNDIGEVYAILDIAVDVTGQVLTQQKIEEAEATLRGATELAKLGTWELDVATGKVTYSDRIKLWFGFTGAAENHNDVYNPIHEKDRSRVETAILHALEPDSTGVYNEEYTLVDQHTGQERIVHAQGITFFDAQRNPVKITGTAQDVTEQRRVRQELERQVAERTQQLQTLIHDLERSNDNLQQFAYVASHDLQEPLRKIRQFGDLLESQYAEQLGDGLSYVERMQAASARMATLIKDLLTFSRIATRQDTKNPVSLHDVFDAVLTDLELVIQEAGAVVDVADLPMVTGDQAQLKQLFQNLVSNALKFRRPDAPVHIRITSQQVQASELPAVSARSGNQAAVYARIDVTDNGIGFDTKYLDRIFEVFQRLHSRSEYAGTGIGLAICQKVVVNHGGVITATSQPGQGATFSVYLPF